MRSSERTRSIELRARNSEARVTLEFHHVPLNAVQSRLRHRAALMPEVDTENYEYRAVIDWIDLVFRTTRKTQWMWIQDEVERSVGRRCYVEGHRDDDTTEHHSFRVRFQEPDFRKVLIATRAVEDRWGLAEPISIENLEVSVDFRPEQPSEEALAKMYAVLTRAHLPGRDVISRPSDRPRFAWGKGKDAMEFVLQLNKGKPEGTDDRLAAVHGDSTAVLDATYYVGEEGSRSMWRTMIKVIDRQNKDTGTRLDLPESKRRVRIEVTLNNDELTAVGLTSLEQLASFRFQTFQGRYFQFWLPTFEQVSETGDHQTAIRRARGEERVQKFLNAGVVGLQAMDEARDRIAASRRTEVKKQVQSTLNKRSRTGKGKSGTLVSFRQLSLPVMHALRRLGARVARDLQSGN